MGGDEWMRDGGGWAGAAYMVIGGRAAAGKSIFVALLCTRPANTKVDCLLGCQRAQQLQTCQSERVAVIGSLPALPNGEGARSLIWKARPCGGATHRIGEGRRV